MTVRGRPYTHNTHACVVVVFIGQAYHGFDVSTKSDAYASRTRRANVFEVIITQRSGGGGGGRVTWGAQTFCARAHGQHPQWQPHQRARRRSTLSHIHAPTHTHTRALFPVYWVCFLSLEVIVIFSSCLVFAVPRAYEIL